ncbi:MAG: VWA domain-containing protein [Gemmatimonadetes bacterium]|uniref:VWA domain-containing protein n=1 Tax=Candidatus Kutchimonas denitrificans TaxID=3056748 RepID=A0AAE4Z9A2_9BACT|nr:VWA domain-containing protein [Gemmatimonadota bacterium]NIR76013.1 VWA domain-containing protein [Candidatus Kutchimonas denitrificans]NIS02205.1 VWA domain-containing protein [Gemmatimonadota bacterium]NIT68031.1 VWA domain-containing protein [Gemmatimonadota bacterium]NIU54057.1 VWA domain-containing protein [Gemmatimonadota bacterium]
MRFEHPLWVWLGILAAAAGVALVYLWHRRRRGALDALGSSGMLERLTGVDLTGTPHRRGALVAAALGLMGFALAGPQWGAEEVEEQTVALSVVLVLDISESMWAEDVTPNRFERQLLEARRLVNELAGHRLGLVVFAGSAYPLSPLTVDHSALRLYLDAADPSMAGTPGSSPASAIGAAVELLGDEPTEDGDRAIVMLSDGESHDEDDQVQSAARAAAAQGIRIFAVGIGSDRGEPIPRYDRVGERIGGFKRDSTGEVVLSRMEAEPLADAADRTGGFWTRADAAGVSRVLAGLAELEAGHGQVTRGVRWTPRFQWFVAAALMLLATDWAWARRAQR